MRGDSSRGDSRFPLWNRSELLVLSIIGCGPTDIWAGRFGSSSTDSGCAAPAAICWRAQWNGALCATAAGALCCRAATGDMGGDAGDDALRAGSAA